VLPVIAALCGMVIPAALYAVTVTAGAGSMDGWAVPMATDMAFDDRGAILIIAVFFTSDLDYWALAGAFAKLTARSAAPHAVAGTAISRVHVCQWPPVSSPLSVLWIRALGSFNPMISTVLPRWTYLVSMASRVATEEASQMWAADRSMTTLSGSPA
jgi:hypothetical protein